MKIFPIISALLVCVALYFIVLDRGSLLALVGAGSEAQAADAAMPIAQQRVNMLSRDAYRRQFQSFI